VAFGQTLDFTDKISMAPERKVGLDALLQAGQLQLLESGSFRLHEWLIHHVGQSGPAPERKRRAQ
jgi:hypothetical protein